MNDVTALVLAAGSGSRFGGRRKQFLELAPGVRLVDAAIGAAFHVTENVVVVVPDGDSSAWEPRLTIVSGGSTRLESVRNGLAEVGEEQKVVLVHDAAHPLAPRSVFIDVVDGIRNGADAAVPVLEVADVVKRKGALGELTTVGRDELGLAQVPMAFSASSLRAAHLEDRFGAREEIWEDSMLVEQAGGRVVAVEGTPWNIHVVTPSDLAMARLLAPFVEEFWDPTFSVEAVEARFAGPGETRRGRHS